MDMIDVRYIAGESMKQMKLDLYHQLLVELFAGAGGMSQAMEEAWGRSPDIAINHDEDALSMHRMNHPDTLHFISDVFEVDPRNATGGRLVGWLHLSPDCTHHSQAAAGQPRDKRTRALAWVGIRWAGQVKPICISLENVRQFLKWGRLIAKRHPETGRVLKRVADPDAKSGFTWLSAEKGERVRVQDQFLIPDPKCEGKTFRKFMKCLTSMGYDVDYRLIVAADQGGHTTRERLYMIARRDGEPILWDDAAFAKDAKQGKERWKPAHECLDFTVPTKSIFDRKKPLAPNTIKRICKGISRFVLDNDDPFIVPLAHKADSPTTQYHVQSSSVSDGGGNVIAPYIVQPTHHGADRVYDVSSPVNTVTGANRGELMLAAPILAKFRGQSHGQSLQQPIPTVTAGGKMQRDAGAAHALGLVAPVLVQTAHGEGIPGGVQRWGEGCRSVERPIGAVAGSNGDAVVAAYMMQANDGFNTTPGRKLTDPVSSVTSSGSQQQLVTANLITLRNNCNGGDLREPVRTVSAEGQHHGLLSAVLVNNTPSQDDAEGSASTPAANAENHQYLSSPFLSSYYTDTSDRCRSIAEPTATVTTENRIGLVECKLSPTNETRALRVARFLVEHFVETGQWTGKADPLNTLTNLELLAIVTVHVKGVPYVIVDIGLRMLVPRELFNAQDFPKNYIIDRGHDGRKFTITQQVRMCGNSVNPLSAVGFLRLNAPHLCIKKAPDTNGGKSHGGSHGQANLSAAMHHDQSVLFA